MKACIFSLRGEARISGEASSLKLVENILQELSIDLGPANEEGCFESNVFSPAARWQGLKTLAGANRVDTLIIKLPTAAQIPLACQALHRFAGRVIFWLDGLLWRSDVTVRQMGTLLWEEPLLTVARILANNPVWPRLARSRNIEIIVSSNTQRDEIAALLPHVRTHVIPNGSVASIGGESVRKPSTFTAGYLGHTYMIKGVWDLLEACDQLRTSGAKLPFRCALSSLGGKKFRAAASGAGMEILAEVDPRKFFASIDLLVAPYWTAWGTQTFPNVLLEAMQFGVPVLTSDLPVCRELFPGNLACFVPPHQPAELASALEQILSGGIVLPGPDALRAHYDANYSRKQVVAGWRKVLEGG